MKQIVVVPLSSEDDKKGLHMHPAGTYFVNRDMNDTIMLIDEAGIVDHDDWIDVIFIGASMEDAPKVGDLVWNEETNNMFKMDECHRMQGWQKLRPICAYHGDIVGAQFSGVIVLNNDVKTMKEANIRCLEHIMRRDGYAWIKGRNAKGQMIIYIGKP